MLGLRAPKFTSVATGENLSYLITLVLRNTVLYIHYDKVYIPKFKNYENTMIHFSVQERCHSGATSDHSAFTGFFDPKFLVRISLNEICQSSSPPRSQNVSRILAPSSFETKFFGTPRTLRLDSSRGWTYQPAGRDNRLSYVRLFTRDMCRASRQALGTWPNTTKVYNNLEFVAGTICTPYLRCEHWTAKNAGTWDAGFQWPEANDLASCERKPRSL